MVGGGGGGAMPNTAIEINFSIFLNFKRTSRVIASKDLVTSLV